MNYVHLCVNNIYLRKVIPHNASFFRKSQKLWQQKRLQVLAFEKIRKFLCFEHMVLRQFILINIFRILVVNKQFQYMHLTCSWWIYIDSQNNACFKVIQNLFITLDYKARCSYVYNDWELLKPFCNEMLDIGVYLITLIYLFISTIYGLIFTLHLRTHIEDLLLTSQIRDDIESSFLWWISQDCIIMKLFVVWLRKSWNYAKLPANRIGL